MGRTFILALAALVTAGCNAESESGTTGSPALPQPSPRPSTAPPPQSRPDAPLGPEEEAAASGAVQDTIPARFHGSYGATREDCVNRSHSRFTISADRIQFFESSAEVLNVRAEGDYAAVTADETYADTTTRYVFYMARVGEDRLRYRYDNNERMTWVRCP